MNYKRASGAIALKCHGDQLYASGLECLLRGVDYIIITKEGMQKGNYDDELLTFLLQLEPKNFQESTAIRRKFAELYKKE